MKLVIGREQSLSSKPDPALVKAVARAYDWFERLKAGRSASIREMAKLEGLTESYVSRVVRLAFFDPHLIESILAGRQPTAMTADSFTLHRQIAILWRDQSEGLLLS